MCMILTCILLLSLITCPDSSFETKFQMMNPEKKYIYIYIYKNKKYIYIYTYNEGHSINKGNFLK